MGRPVSGKTVQLLCGAGSMLVLMAASATSFAQQPPQEPAPGPIVTPSVTPSAEPPPPAATPYPPPAPPPAPAPPPPPVVQREPEPEIDRAATDLNPQLRRWAIGYAGISQVPVIGGTFNGGNNVDVTAPAVGIRYWASQTVGVDFAFGITWAGGSMEAGPVSTDKNSITGFVFQGGVPIALATHRHVAFEVIPMLAIAHGSMTIGSGASAMDFSGTRIDVGARAGFEVFFGFIGIPQLALNATIGLEFESKEYKLDSGGLSQSDTTLTFATTVQNNPWDIFAGNIAARYYF